MSAPVEVKTLGPEELVRRENKAVCLLKIILLAVLVVLGSSLSLGCYKLSSRWEVQTYHDDFEVISKRFIEQFHDAMTQVMWNAYTIGVAISANYDSVKNAPNITIPLFDKLPVGAFQTNNLNHVFWSPLISDDKERKEWEAYALQQLLTTDNANVDLCYVCGSPNLEVGSPNVAVQLPVGTYDCGKFA
jgi:hypothetical protein